MVRARGIAMIPEDRARIETIGGDTDLSNVVVPELDFSYFSTDNLALELILATTPHDIDVENSAIGDRKIGSVWLLPPTPTLQYHFLPRGDRSPYVGAGVNFTLFYGIDEKNPIQKIDIDPAFGWALQAGFDYRIADRWYLNVDVKKLFLDADAEINRAVDAEVEINPWIFGSGVGYRF
ncbi:MAG: outer membrane beta-barrel protein [Geminicoccaceae bacterium]|nr:outer membrane beta-barrel protein [Geminicoccaceae bacterium]